LVPVGWSVRKGLRKTNKFLLPATSKRRRAATARPALKNDKGLINMMDDMTTVNVDGIDYELDELADNGDVWYNGMRLYLLRPAYVSEDGDYYLAPAIDAEGNRYRVTWDVTNHDAENEDESCDWDIYEVYKVI
jgi:hypothetical protein